VPYHQLPDPRSLPFYYSFSPEGILCRGLVRNPLPRARDGAYPGFILPRAAAVPDEPYQRSYAFVLAFLCVLGLQAIPCGVRTAQRKGQTIDSFLSFFSLPSKTQGPRVVVAHHTSPHTEAGCRRLRGAAAE
jgi:hypothetical protein